MRVTQAESYRNLLSGMEALNRNLNTVNQQISSGRRLTDLKDSPIGSAELVTLAEKASQIDQYRSNSDSCAFFLGVAESALNEVQNVVTAIYTAGSEGASGYITADTRAVIADEIRTMRDQLLSLANTQARDRYVFAGSQANTVPFVLSGDSVTYQGDSSVNTVSVDDGLEVRQGADGSTVFNGIFAAVSSLLTALDADDSSSIQSALEEVSSALSGLGRIRAQVGAALGQLQDVNAHLDTYKVAVQQQRGNIEDTDLAEASIQLSQLQTALKAAVSAASSILPRNSLFDILG